MQKTSHFQFSKSYHKDMSLECANMTWPMEIRQMGQFYLAVAIPAFVFHVLFWIQVATNQTLRQMSMFWVYNYLITDILLLVQLFVEYSSRTMSACVSDLTFNVLCKIEAYTNSYMSILEAYMLVCLNLTRYYLIVKNRNISSQHPHLLIVCNICLCIIGLSILIFQSLLFKIMRLESDRNTGSCSLDYANVGTRIGNLIIVLLIPIILNFYFMTVTTIHVRRSALAARAQV